MDYSFCATHSLDGPMDCRWWVNVNIVVIVVAVFTRKKCILFKWGLLFCQPRVTVKSCFVYKVITDLASIDHWSVHVSILLSNCKQRITSLSYLVGTTVVCHKLTITVTNRFQTNIERLKLWSSDTFLTCLTCWKSSKLVKFSSTAK